MNFYAVFNIETGDISSITNVLPEDSNYTEIDKQMYIDFVQDKLDYGNFLVVADPKIKGKYQLVEKQKSNNQFDIEKSIHQFEQANDNEFELDTFYIIQDNANNEWRAKAKLQDQYVKFLNQTKDFGYKRVYVTQANNPNILLDVLNIELEHFTAQDEFAIKSIDSDKNVSLYANVTHESYKHIIRS